MVSLHFLINSHLSILSKFLISFSRFFYPIFSQVGSTAPSPLGFQQLPSLHLLFSLVLSNQPCLRRPLVPAPNSCLSRCMTSISAKTVTFNLSPCLILSPQPVSILKPKGSPTHHHLMHLMRSPALEALSHPIIPPLITLIPHLMMDLTHFLPMAPTRLRLIAHPPLASTRPFQRATS